MALYKLSINPNMIIRTTDNLLIPIDSKNQDYKDYLAWVALGNLVDPSDIQLARSARLNDLAIQLDINKFKNIVYNANTYSANHLTQLQIEAFLAAYDRGFTSIFPMNWILDNGTTISQTYDDIKGLSGAIATRTKACYDNYISLVSSINGSSNPSSIDVTVGWPA